MSENFLPERINDIILANRFIVEARRESFGVNLERLESVVNIVNAITENDIPDQKRRIIVKASHLLGGITYRQPFDNGNKTTATTVTIDFLRRNGYDLPIVNENDEEEHISLLEETLYKFEDDQTIISDVEQYLWRKVVP
jgi:prophage maintenance system killer protein